MKCSEDGRIVRGKSPILNWVSAVSFGLLLVFVGLLIFADGLEPRKHNISINKDFHVGVVSRGWDGRLAFFKDEEYGPYQGSIIALGDDSEFVKTARLTVCGTYYRYFKRSDGAVLYTLTVSLWYPIALCSILPACWCLQRLKRPETHKREGVR